MPVFLVRWAVQNRFVVIPVCVALSLLGFLTLPRQQVDALPDLSDTQVILQARWEQAADLVEAQVTFPLTRALLGAPKVTAVRGFTERGSALVYVVFEDGTDLYWARSRVAELLTKITASLPAEARVEIGPDATGVGWIFQYALVDETGQHSLADLRSFQDWNLRYALEGTPGVAEVAPVGGFEKEYQVTVQPDALEQYGVPFRAVVEAVRNSTMDSDGQQIEMSGRRLSVRGRGLAHSIEDLERAVVYGQRSSMDLSATQVPVLLRDIARIEAVPRSRQGLADMDGKGETVGGIVVMRQGENALEVIRRVKKRLEGLKASLPEGVRIVTTYDRSELIRRSIATLRNEVFLAACVVSLVIWIFLRHFASVLVAVATIPVVLLIALLPLYWLGINLNIMSLAGMVLSVGVLVDGAIIQVENVHRSGDIRGALEEVAPAVFLSLLSITVTFFPIFALTGQEGRLFRPLAAAKTIVMVTAALVTLTFAPALRMLFGRTEPHHQPGAPSFRLGAGAYERTVRFLCRRSRLTVVAAMLLVIAAIPVYLRLTGEFMPPLNEETLLYMPTTLPGIPVAEALRVLQHQDAVLAAFPEVARVFGKAGRAQTATDPAPLSMIETTVLLKPREQWRQRPRWYTRWIPGCQGRISYDELIAEMDRAVALPGVVNSWTMPIRGRTEMVNTGVRTPVAVKVTGPDLVRAQELGQQLEAVLRRIPGIRSAFAERAIDESFVDIQVDRDRLAERGLQMSGVQEVIAGTIGGAPAAEIYEGRSRYPVTVRYPRKFRQGIDEIGQITVPAESGERVPLREIATIRQIRGNGMLRSENAVPASHVFVDVETDDIGKLVEDAQQAIARQVTLPSGYSLQWSGDYENTLRVRERLRIVIPAAVVLLLLLLYLNTRSWVKTMIVVSAVPFSMIGAVGLLYALGYHLSVATWVGVIALVGLDAETGVFMLLFLDLEYEKARRNGWLERAGGLTDAIVTGAAKRLRPKLMTVAAAFAGLLPSMLATGTGADLTKRIVAPLVGGLSSSFVLELLVYPALYFWWKQTGTKRHKESGLSAVKTALQGVSH